MFHIIRRIALLSTNNRVQIKISLNGYTVRAIVNHVISRLIAIPTGDLLTSFKVHLTYGFFYAILFLNISTTHNPNKDYTKHHP